jgi:glycosyltransferase involved in cell wall biosynthesis
LSSRRSRWSLIENLCDHINLSGADIIAVVSEELKSRLIKVGVASARIIVNPNGVNPKVFSDKVSVSAVKKALPKDRIFVGFIGIFGQWHGVLTLAACVKYVCEQEPRTHFLIIGAGDLKDQMIAILKRDGMLGSVTFAGVVAHEDAPKYLNACDVLVSPHEDMADGSAFFGSPTKIFEYMAMGKGIVASRVGQLGYILEDGRNALLVEQKDPRDLARAIVELISDADKRMELGREARRTAVKTYTWQHNFQRIVDHLGHSSDPCL